MMLEKTLLLFAIPALCQGFGWFSRNQSDWNGLKVTWGVTPWGAFNNVPRTQQDAEGDSWTNMAPQDACDGNSKFRGLRYWKNNDPAVILVFDTNGYIAGIQAGFDAAYSPNPNGFPKPVLQNKPLVLDGGRYYITAYFVNPATLCAGRSASQFRQEGTGTGLWIQNGTDPVRDSVKMPARQSDADNTMWIEGACFYTMGQHYWYNIEQDMSCDRFFPVFLMYNDGVLNSFGWAFGMDLQNSDRWEHPLQGSYHYFMNHVPVCLGNVGTLTTLHIYLTDSAYAMANRC